MISSLCLIFEAARRCRWIVIEKKRKMGYGGCICSHLNEWFSFRKGCEKSGISTKFIYKRQYCN